MFGIGFDTPSVKCLNTLDKIIQVSKNELISFHGNDLDVVKLIVNANNDILGIFHKKTFDYKLTKYGIQEENKIKKVINFKKKIKNT